MRVTATYQDKPLNDASDILQMEFASVQEAWLNMPPKLEHEFRTNRENCQFIFDYELYVFAWMCRKPLNNKHGILYMVYGDGKSLVEKVDHVLSVRTPH